MILAIDPGKQHLGWAHIADGTLRCGRYATTLQPPDAWHDLVRVLPRGVSLLVIERMVSYPGAKRRADPNDLLPLAGLAGACTIHVQAWRTLWVEPGTWKGQLPKAVHHARVRAKMSEAHIDTMDKACDALRAREALDVRDAVALALWAQERHREGTWKSSH